LGGSHEVGLENSADPCNRSAGQQLPYTDLPGKVFAPNLTPDKESGAGNWTDDMVARAIREGIGYDGRAQTEIIFPVKYIMRNYPQPITGPVASPDVSDPVKRGRFLVNLIGCADCHTPIDNHHAPILGLEFSGGQVLQVP
jgi:hypothetical protein